MLQSDRSGEGGGVLKLVLKQEINCLIQTKIRNGVYQPKQRRNVSRDATVPSYLYTYDRS